ncbi:universal stress protein [Haloferax namakaokahaiae]|uniref:Universal stress protein n=1 Tax=Haloferax namakaokahaiae TaxID=1748331 RepID=A0ABD5ZB14_9EURY
MTETVESLFARPLLPIANEADATATCRAAFPHIAGQHGQATVVHVIEKAGGAPDKAGVEQREELADEVFDIVARIADEFGLDVKTELRFATDVAEEILDVADETDATAIVFSPREGRGWWDLFSGDVRKHLVHNDERPVVVLPGSDETEPDSTTDDGDR